MRKRWLAMMLPGLFQAVSAYADTEDMDQLLSLSMKDLMETKVTISTNTEKELSKAPSVVSIITSEDIKATGATNVVDVLQSIPGVYVQANLFAYRPIVTFRGAAGTHTLLMINGVPERDLVWDPGIFWKGFPANMIDRVEVIRGPGSALYGSDASAGVINIITKTNGSMPQSEAGMRAGSSDTQEGWVQHSTKWLGFDIAFSAEGLHTNGPNLFIPQDGQTTLDRKYGTAASYAPGYANYGYDNQDLHFSASNGNWRVLGDYMRQNNLQIGLTGGGELDPVTRGDDSRLNLQLLYANEQAAKDLGVNAQLRYSRIYYTSGNGFQEDPPGFANASGLYPNGSINHMTSAEREISGEASALYSGFKTHAIRFGAGTDSDDLYLVEQSVNAGTGPNGTPLPAGGPVVSVTNTPYAFAPEKTRQINYFLVQDVWTFARDWELTGGARYDHYSDFGGTVNPRLALVWQSTEKLTTKLMYGQAFRAPSFLQLFAYSAATLPNPNLKPERSKTIDLSFSYAASKDLTLGVDFYGMNQYDLILQDASNRFQNMGNNRAEGIELEAKWQATEIWRLSGNVSDRDDLTNPYNTIPKQKAYVRSDLAFLPAWNWDVQANWIGSHSLAPGNPRSPIGAYTVMDTTLRYAYRRDWEFAASIRNLFNADARELSSAALPQNLPLPGRTLYAEVRF
jgi:outer membrane cobalamin receptor